jgi:hypothetical protein
MTMLTSESDARLKWCPFTRVEGGNRLNNTLNDGFENAPAPFHCVAGKCMFWREMHYSHLKAGAAKSLVGHGYCGAAGKPDLE